MKVKNKTFQIEFFLKRYGAISRTTAIAKYQCFDLPSAIRRINDKNRTEASKNGHNPVIYRAVPGTSPNTKYKLWKQEQ